MAKKKQKFDMKEIDWDKVKKISIKILLIITGIALIINLVKLFKWAKKKYF